MCVTYSLLSKVTLYTLPVGDVSPHLHLFHSLMPFLCIEVSALPQGYGKWRILDMPSISPKPKRGSAFVLFVVAFQISLRYYSIVQQPVGPAARLLHGSKECLLSI